MFFFFDTFINSRGSFEFVVMGFSFKYFAIPYMDRNLIETFKFIDSQRVDHTLDEWLETEPKPNASQEQ